MGPTLRVYKVLGYNVFACVRLSTPLASDLRYKLFDEEVCHVTFPPKPGQKARALPLVSPL